MRAILIAVLFAGCFLLTDGATRVAQEIGDAASRLRASPQQELEFRFLPDGRPDGVRGRYEIVLQESLNHPKSGGALLVGDLASESYALHGYNWSTTSHLHHVRVRHTLKIQKPSGEPTVFVLRKSGETIDVVELR